MYWVMNLQAFAFAIGVAFAQQVLKYHGCHRLPIKMIDVEGVSVPLFHGGIRYVVWDTLQIVQVLRSPF